MCSKRRPSLESWAELSIPTGHKNLGFELYIQGNEDLHFLST